MKVIGWFSEIMLVFLLFFSLFCVFSASAGSIPNMKGTWDTISLEKYSPDTGYEDITSTMGPFIIKTQDSRAFAGEYSYTENGQVVSETVAAALSADGMRFWQDHYGTALSVGEMVSDHEFYNYMMFPDEGPMVIISHMVKNGTHASTWVNQLPNLVGTWSFTQKRNGGDDTSTGEYTVDSQQDRIWTGSMRVTEEDGSLPEMKLVGVIGDGGTVYAVTDTGAFHFGTLTGDDIWHQIMVHPGDDDKTYLTDRWLSRNGAIAVKPDVTYPDITGNWTIENRKDISNGTVIDMGLYHDDWISNTNQTKQFFTALRHLTDEPVQTGMPGVLFGTDTAFLAGDSPIFIVYDLPNEKTIEAIIIRNLKEPAIYFDKLVPD